MADASCEVASTTPSPSVFCMSCLPAARILCTSGGLSLSCSRWFEVEMHLTALNARPCEQAGCDEEGLQAARLARGCPVKVDRRAELVLKALRALHDACSAIERIESQSGDRYSTLQRSFTTFRSTGEKARGEVGLKSWHQKLSTAWARHITSTHYTLEVFTHRDETHEHPMRSLSMWNNANEVGRVQECSSRVSKHF